MQEVTWFTSSCYGILASRGCTISEATCTYPAHTTLWPAVQNGNKLLGCTIEHFYFSFINGND
jgi:hypothetical protein